jgi:hypothetical protein
MHWQPDPFPSMERYEYDDLAKYMLANNGWGDLPAIIVDDEGNLIDGYKRRQVYMDLREHHAWPPHTPAYVLQGVESFPDEAERARQYAALREAVNNHSVLIDEIENWLRHGDR